MISTVEEERIYWQRRTDALLAQLERDEERLYEKLGKVYDSEAAKLERDIAAYYQRFGVDGVIEYRRLLESISPEDERLLYEKMEEFAAKYPQYAHLMPIRATIYKLNEMEAIQYGIRLQQLEIGAIEQEAVEAHLTKYARKAANLAAEQDGQGADFYTYDSDIVKLTVNSAWADGEHFSERIWGNRENLAKYLNDDFGKLIARGVNYEKCVSELRKKYENTSRKNVKRLVFTEGTFIFNEAQARAHEGTYEYYSLSTCADKKVCEVCADIERRSKETPIRFSERAPGVNFPPLHPWCRCCYTVAVTDWDAWIDSYVLEHGGDPVSERQVSEAVQSVLWEASAHEPLVSAALKSAEDGSAKLSGFEYRIKGEGSLTRKVKTEAILEKSLPMDAANGIHDVLRYTFILPEKGFSQKYSGICGILKYIGIAPVKVKNTLKMTGVAYRGVNCQFETSDGYRFELQFHTEASLDVKERLNHPLYEKARLLETSEQEKAELSRMMIENSDSIPMPDGIMEV